MRVEVQVVEGPEAGISFAMEKNTRRTVGRGDESSVQLCEDELLSRVHFSLEFDGLSLHLTDLGSTNGTFLGGKAIPPNTPVPLQDQSSFIAGRVSKFVVRVVGSQPVAPIAPASPDILAAPTPPDTAGNFGSSFYSSQPSPPPVAPPSTMSEGNFSQSIRQDFNEQNPILGNFGGGGSQIFGGKSDISPPQSSDSYEAPELADPSDGLNMDFDDYGTSIAPPGQQGGNDAGMMSYQGYDPLTGDSSIRRPDLSPMELDIPPEPAPPQPQQPESGEQLSDAEMKTPSVYAPGTTAKPQGKTAKPPQPQPPAPTNEPPQRPASPFESIGYAGASIASPGMAQQPAPPVRAPQVTPVTNQAPSDSMVPGAQGSIGLPGQIYQEQAPKRRPTGPTEKPQVAPKKACFQVWRLDNGLFFHAGNDLDDLKPLISGLQQKFESIFCAHFARTDLELNNEPETVDAKKPEPTPEPVESSNFSDTAVETDDSDSPFADDSPFAEDVGLDTAPIAEAPPAEVEKKESSKIGDPLFHWLPKEGRWGGPVLLKPDEISFDFKEVWNQDAFVSFFGGSGEQMSNHLKTLVRTDLRSGRASDSMFGFCWPTVMYGTLESQKDICVSRIFDLGGICAILFEDPNGEFAWCLASKNDLSEHLYAAGFARV